ncbi:MAG: hypothetical protein U5K29_15055 [Acidimicrobiales bacterium]|nr:hypothetical protein [Acidimicrobiales bacterium]
MKASKNGVLARGVDRAAAPCSPVGAVAQQVGPPRTIAIARPALASAHDDEVLEVGRLQRGHAVGDGLHVHRPAATLIGVGAHHDPGSWSRFQREATAGAPNPEKMGDDDRADAGRGEQHDHGIETHGKVAGDAVARSCAELAEGRGRPLDQAQQVGVGVLDGVSVLGLDDDGRAFGGHRRPPVDAHLGHVHRSVDEPTTPLDAVGDVDHL